MEQFNKQERQSLIEETNSAISIRKQCEILGVNRRSIYYESKQISPFNIVISNAIRMLYLNYPFYGHRKVTKVLNNMGFKVNIKRVQRIRNELKLRTIYPEPNLSKPKKEHKKYPYLLKGLEIKTPNYVWAQDITYMKLKGKGWVYMTAIIDWYSRYILSYEVSITLEIDFCLSALEKAFSIAKPQIFNTDQGS